MKSTTPRNPHFFDTRNVMLIAAMALGGGTSLYAQTSTPPAQTTGQSPFTTGGTPKAPMGRTEPHQRSLLQRADTNHDGKLSAQEAKAFPSSATALSSSTPTMTARCHAKNSTTAPSPEP